jgi:hypothetical protein
VEGRAGRETVMRKLVAAFRNFVNVPKKKDATTLELATF